MGVDWSEFTVHPTTFHEAGSVVVVEGRYRATHSNSRSLDCQFAHVWTINHGQITRFQQYTDTSQLRQVMGWRSD